MAEANFKSLQHLHESMLQKQQNIPQNNQQDFAAEVREYIEQAKRAGSYIASTRERDQIRANLRYWANYIYGIEGVFPDTELAPSTVTEGNHFWKSSLGLIIAGLAFVFLIVAGSILLNDRLTTVEPTAVPATSDLGSTEVAPVTTATEVASTSDNVTPTSVFNTAVLVVLTNPENGANVLPRVQFTGVSTNLKADDSIHLLIIRGDRFFPIDDYVKQSQVSSAGEWNMDALLYQDESDLEQPENLIIVPAVCSNQQCRDTLTAAVKTGFDVSPLPSQLTFDSFTVYKDSSRVLYRSAYQAVQETRLVYSRVVETPAGDKPYDLFTVRTDGSDFRQLTFTTKVNEDWPDLSPDGTKIAYVHFDWTTGEYSIHVMDSNGQNDQEITAPQKSILENPQWSPDGEYISYALGNTSRSVNATYWSIRAYRVSTKEDVDVSGEEGPLILNRYHSWAPNSRDIIFNAGIKNNSTSGFVKASIDAPEDSILFFDTGEDDIQPSLYDFGGGYLLTYTVIKPVTYHHEIYAVVDTDKEFPFDGTPVRLTSENYGADLPIFEPDSSSVYYLGSSNNIYAVPISINGNGITLVSSTGPSGTLIVTSEPNERVVDFVIGYMDTFFPAP